MVSTEEALIQRAKQDPEAFGELYEIYFKKIYWYVFDKVKLHPETQDIVSETFYKALRSLDTYIPTGKPFVGWLYRIAQNCTIDYFRRNKREIKVGWMENMGEETKFEQVEYREWLERAMKLLTEDQQEVLQLHYIEDMKFKDIAIATNRTEGAVKALSIRAIARLRSVMQKEGVDFGG